LTFLQLFDIISVRSRLSVSHFVSERYVVNAVLLRSLFRRSVCLSVCLCRACAVSKHMTCYRICLHHLIYRSGSIEKKTVQTFSQLFFPDGLLCRSCMSNRPVSRFVLETIQDVVVVTLVRHCYWLDIIYQVLLLACLLTQHNSVQNRVYDSKARRYAEDNKTESNCTY